jgi:hypothetical protein
VTVEIEVSAVAVVTTGAGADGVVTGHMMTVLEVVTGVVEIDLTRRLGEAPTGPPIVTDTCPKTAEVGTIAADLPRALLLQPHEHLPTAPARDPREVAAATETGGPAAGRSRAEPHPVAAKLASVQGPGRGMVTKVTMLGAGTLPRQRVAPSRMSAGARPCPRDEDIPVL